MNDAEYHRLLTELSQERAKVARLRGKIAEIADAILDKHDDSDYMVAVQNHLRIFLLLPDPQAERDAAVLRAAENVVALELRDDAMSETEWTGAIRELVKAVRGDKK